MLSIFASSFQTAARQDRWDAPSYWTTHRQPMNRRQAQQLEAERKLANLRNVGMW